MKLQFDLLTGQTREVYTLDTLPMRFPAQQKGNEYRVTLPRDNCPETVAVTYYPTDVRGWVWIPFWLGQFIQPPGQHEWKARTYPGLMSPLILRVGTDRVDAMYDIDSTPCRVMWDGLGLRLEYHVTPGQVLRFAAYRARTWRDVVGDYRAMLAKRGAPPAVRLLAGNVHHMGLQNYRRWEADPWRRRVEAVTTYAPNMILWGWMSNYAGPPELAEPAIEPGEDVGCCLYRTAGHRRYAGIAAMVAMARNANRNLKVLPYVRVPEGGTLRDVYAMMQAADRALGVNPGQQGDGYYLDEFGVRPDLGERPDRLGMAIDRWGSSVLLVVEGANECQHVPALVSGCLDASNKDTEAMRIGRSLQPDRQMIFGHSNGDHAHPIEYKVWLADALGLTLETTSPTWLG